MLQVSTSDSNTGMKTFTPLADGVIKSSAVYQSMHQSDGASNHWSLSGKLRAA